ncbi:MAG: hypothetical protein ACXQS8_09510 [Candidatus Helarchaeales archaeon]
MHSSITIPDELRKKIKRLAALFNTSQVEIIQRAMQLFEEMYLIQNDMKDPRLITILSSISKEVHSKNPNRGRRSKKLSGSGPRIDSLTPAFWGRVVDE